MNTYFCVGYVITNEKILDDSSEWLIYNKVPPNYTLFLTIRKNAFLGAKYYFKEEII